MARRLPAFFLCAVIAAMFAACGGCHKAAPPAQTTGFDTPEQLAQKYLEAISKKDYDLLQSLLLEKEDLKPFQKQMNNQGVEVYRQFVLRDFKARNRDYLGKELKYVGFRLGREVWSTDQYGLIRGSIVIAELADGTKANIEMNFLSRFGQKWKIFSLRYLKDLKGANPGAPAAAPTPPALPGAKFGPEKAAIEMKVKKVEPPAGADASPAAPPPTPPAGTAPPPPPEAPKPATKKWSKEGK